MSILPSRVQKYVTRKVIKTHNTLGKPDSTIEMQLARGSLWVHLWSRDYRAI
jgi:hypothetical protein